LGHVKYVFIKLTVDYERFRAIKRINVLRTIKCPSGDKATARPDKKDKIVFITIPCREKYRNIYFYIIPFLL
jgi:hypothetical protein